MTQPQESKFSFSHWEKLSPAQITHAAATFVLLLMCFRLLILWVLPLELSGDEAYYWQWGRNIDLGYFSKPPGIGWLMWLAGKVGGDTTFGMRMFAVFLGTGTLWLLYKFTAKLYNPAVAIIAAITFVANPANAALNLILTIDAPLVFFWTLALYAFWNFIQPATNAWKWGTILTFGLAGGILSKQMMLVFPVLAVLFLLFSNAYRSQLKRPALWACLTLSLLALVPPLVWNAQNDWLTVAHTMHHFESGSPTITKRFVRFFEYVGSQLGIFTPILCGLMYAVLFAAAKSWRNLADRERFLWIFSAPVLFAILMMALRQRINPNWPAVFYISATTLVVAWAAGKWSLDLKLDSWRRAFGPGLKLGIGIAVIAYISVATLTLGLVKLPNLDPSARLRGWSAITKDVQSAREKLPKGLMVIAQGHRYLASELAFHLPDQPHVYLYNPDPTVITSQHDLWDNPSARLGEDGLIVAQGASKEVTAGLGARFESTELLKITNYPGAGGNREAISIFLGRNLKRWPTVKNP